MNYNCNCPWELGDVIFLLVLGLPRIHFVAAAAVKNGYWEWRAAAGGRRSTRFSVGEFFASREFAYYLDAYGTWNFTCNIFKNFASFRPIYTVTCISQKFA